jgi:hypothetical protein
MHGSPGAGPWTASRVAAASRTLRVTASSLTTPPPISPKSGAADTRPRDGLRPTSPQWLAGTRIDPPPSLACAAVTMPAATAAADPPLDPPGERSRSQGLRVGPYAAGSAVGIVPNSDVFVRPRITKPASRKRLASHIS